ncbi:MAG: hypothetical protein FJ149_05535 [Euryarchaeota archaeon]|nr:hypothetical protein [Euryarchaeota archaeon]
MPDLSPEIAHMVERGKLHQAILDQNAICLCIKKDIEQIENRKSQNWGRWPAVTDADSHAAFTNRLAIESAKLERLRGIEIELQDRDNAERLQKRPAPKFSF